MFSLPNIWSHYANLVKLHKLERLYSSTIDADLYREAKYKPLSSVRHYKKYGTQMVQNKLTLETSLLHIPKCPTYPKVCRIYDSIKEVPSNYVSLFKKISCYLNKKESAYDYRKAIEYKGY